MPDKVRELHAKLAAWRRELKAPDADEELRPAPAWETRKGRNET